VAPPIMSTMIVLMGAWMLLIAAARASFCSSARTTGCHVRPRQLHAVRKDWQGGRHTEGVEGTAQLAGCAVLQLADQQRLVHGEHVLDAAHARACAPQPRFDALSQNVLLPPRRARQLQDLRSGGRSG